MRLSETVMTKGVRPLPASHMPDGADVPFHAMLNLHAPGHDAQEFGH